MKPALCTSLATFAALAALAAPAAGAEKRPEPPPPPGYSMKQEMEWSKVRGDFKQRAATVARRVQELRKRLEEWGSVTVSAPLIMKEIGDFNLGEDKDFPNTLQYINLALTSAQGGVSQSTQTAFSNELQLTVTPTFSINPLTGEKVQRPATDGDKSLTPDDVAQGPKFDLAGVIASAGTGAKPGQFTAPGSMIIGPNAQKGVLKPAAGGGNELTPNSSFILSGAQAAMIGSNAKISELLIRQMANPKQRLFTNPHYQIHFVIVQVSCNPGWRTRENYIADVSATTEYYATDAPSAHSREPVEDGKETVSFESDSERKVTPGWPKSVDQDGFRPRVFSVLPLIDAQTLELLNSERRFTQLAASISAAFPTAAANLKGRDIMQFVKQFQKDTQTVTPRTVANSYSSGAIFGFRLMPSLTALKDPARSGSKPANILQATTFPVLVTVVTSRKDATKLKADSVRVRIANRWLLNDRPPFKEVWRRIGLPMWRESTSARLDLALMFGEAEEDLELLRLDYPVNDVYDEAVLTLQRDLHELRQKVIGADTPIFPLPPPAGVRQRTMEASARSPVIQRIIPAELSTQGRAALFIGGLNFFPSSEVELPFLRAADDKSDTGIRVFLGQIEGLVRATDGDEQLVVEFKDLERLNDLASAPLVISTRFGSTAWGEAVKLVPPSPAAKSKDPVVKSVTPTPLNRKEDKTYTQLNMVVAGANLGDVKSAKLVLASGATVKVEGTNLLFTSAEAIVAVATLSATPEDTTKATLQLFKTNDATGDPLLKPDASVPGKK